MLSMKDLYWLAGVLEGEGCFTADRVKDKCYPKVTLRMTDEDTVRKAAKLFGTNTHEYENNSENFIVTRKTKNIFQSSIVGIEARGWMMTLYSLMGVRRQQKIKELLLQSRANHDFLKMDQKSIDGRNRQDRYRKKQALVNLFVALKDE